MTNPPKFFTSQKQCSAALGIPVSKLKEYARQGCPAMKWSRIYTTPLLKFIEAEKRRANTAAKNRDAAISRTLSALAECRELEILDEVQYVEFGKAIAERSPALLVSFIKSYVEE
jgi:hypothetical protein